MRFKFLATSCEDFTQEAHKLNKIIKSRTGLTRSMHLFCCSVKINLNMAIVLKGIKSMKRCRPV